ncbi:hypothetical protein [Amphibacillus jilinensis]|uniref:lmo0954 family membrane protein n=1 Tax=Amphibacillus jilinensis TaxID=1216008 RepID=UPI0002DF4E11|nr:hypothetical protein [Amphibacillus jilinensis]
MRTLLFIVIAGIAGLIVLSTVAPLIGLFLTLALGYYGVRRFLLTDSALGKLGWAVLVLIALSMSISNTPALVGIVAALLLYYAYRGYRKAPEGYEQEDWMID